MAMSNLNGKDKQHTPVLKFPCDFTLKVMGKSTAEFTDLVLNIVRQHFPDFNEQQLQKRFSQFTHYTSLSVTVHAESQQQLDNLYRQLTSTPEILVVL